MAPLTLARCAQAELAAAERSMSLPATLMWAGIILLPILAVVAKELLGKTWGAPRIEETDVYAAISAALEQSENVSDTSLAAAAAGSEAAAAAELGR